MALSYKSITNQLEYLIAIFDNICCNNPTTLSKEQAFFLEKGVCLNKIYGLYDKIGQFLGSYFVNTTPLEIDMLISHGRSEVWKQDLFRLFKTIVGSMALMGDVDHYELGLGINNIDYVEIYKVLEAMISILEKVKPEDLTKVEPDSLQLERLKLTKFIFSRLYQVYYGEPKDKLGNKLKKTNTQINNYYRDKKLSPDENPVDLDELILRFDKISKKNKIVDVNKWILKIFFIPEKNRNKWIMFGTDVVLFLIILSAFIMPCFIPVSAFLHSVLTFSLEIICGLLSLAYGIILIKSIYFENENDGEINIKIKNDECTLKSKSEIGNNQDIALENNEQNLLNK